MPTLTKTKSKKQKKDDKVAAKDSKQKDDNSSDDAQDYLNSLEEKAAEKGEDGCIFC